MVHKLGEPVIYRDDNDEEVAGVIVEEVKYKDFIYGYNVMLANGRKMRFAPEDIEEYKQKYSLLKASIVG